MIQLPGGASIQVLYHYPLPNAPTLKIVALKVSYEPGGFTEKHRHGNAFVTATILEGSVESKVNDGPTKVYGVGEAWSENPGDMHIISRNPSKDQSASFIATFVCPLEQEEYVV